MWNEYQTSVRSDRSGGGRFGPLLLGYLHHVLGQTVFPYFRHSFLKFLFPLGYSFQHSQHVLYTFLALLVHKILVLLFGQPAKIDHSNVGFCVVLLVVDKTQRSADKFVPTNGSKPFLDSSQFRYGPIQYLLLDFIVDG